MSYNSPKFDKDAHYAAMSRRELEALVARYEEFLRKHPAGTTINEELQLVRMKLAERVGRNKK